MLRQNGLALGGSLENAIVLGETGVLNNALRFEDEFVRHKILDAVGDLALVGYPVIGHLVAHRAGHALHTEFAAKILEETQAWRLVEGRRVRRCRSACRSRPRPGSRTEASRSARRTAAAAVRTPAHAGAARRHSPELSTAPCMAAPESSWQRYMTQSVLSVVSDPQRSNQSTPSLTRSNFSA